MNVTWSPIVLSAKVFGHLSQGLYRTPAGAIKELISNSFDADATTVRIHTGFPRFETFTCEDDGVGLSRKEFARLVEGGIGSSYKRTADAQKETVGGRPFIGRLGLGILSLAQICTQFEITSHHTGSKTAFRATIKFPPYTRQEMDKIALAPEQPVRGGEYYLDAIDYDPERHGMRIFTKFLREPFRKRMRALSRYGNKKTGAPPAPYKTFSRFLDTIYASRKKVQSLNLLSDYDQMLFGIALAAPLPFVADRNVAVGLPLIKRRQSVLEGYEFQVRLDNLRLAHPVCLPSDRDGHTASQCVNGPANQKEFQVTDGAAKELCSVRRRSLTITDSDETLNLYQFKYGGIVAGSRLDFNGYLFQQTGRLYPRDIQGVLIRINDVAIGKYDNSMLTYPYAEGPRYSMVSSEIFVTNGFEDALNIDRDSFNELHPHYIRLQAYVHALLHDVIFPETWSEEKERNKGRREQQTRRRTERFVERYRSATGDAAQLIRRTSVAVADKDADAASPVEFGAKRDRIYINHEHPLVAALFKRAKYASLVERIVIAFERSNKESTDRKRRALFYSLLAEIIADL